MSVAQWLSISFYLSADCKINHTCTVNCKQTCLLNGKHVRYIKFLNIMKYFISGLNKLLFIQYLWDYFSTWGRLLTRQLSRRWSTPSTRTVSRRRCCIEAFSWKMTEKEKCGKKRFTSMKECQAKPIQDIGIVSQGVKWDWSRWIKSHHPAMCSEDVQLLK